MPAEGLATRILLHLVEISRGECSIDVESAMQEPDEEVAQVLLGIQLLHEELRYRENEFEARVAAEASDRAKTAFMTTMSHELRTPLNAILGYAGLIDELAEEGVDSRALRPDIAKIHTAGSHLLALINDVLDLARIEAGQSPETQERFDLAQVALEAARVVEVVGGRKGVAVSAQTASVFVRVDRRRMLQCVLNVMMNAVKFTDAGSVVVTVGRADGWAVIRVVDTGRGVAERDLERVFEPFVQTDPDGAGGTGLGLAITRGLVRSMGGSITASSVVGRGSTFEVRIPVADRC